MTRRKLRPAIAAPMAVDALRPTGLFTAPPAAPPRNVVAAGAYPPPAPVRG
jgi:hypothetical protein